MRRRLYGREHPEVADSLMDLAEVLQDRGDLDGAETLFREALAMRRKLLGEDRATGVSMNMLAHLLRARRAYGRP